MHKSLTREQLRDDDLGRFVEEAKTEKLRATEWQQAARVAEAAAAKYFRRLNSTLQTLWKREEELKQSRAIRPQQQPPSQYQAHSFTRPRYETGALSAAAQRCATLHKLVAMNSKALREKTAAVAVCCCGSTFLCQVRALDSRLSYHSAPFCATALPPHFWDVPCPLCLFLFFFSL